MSYGSNGERTGNGAGKGERGDDLFQSHCEASRRTERIKLRESVSNRSAMRRMSRLKAW